MLFSSISRTRKAKQFNYTPRHFNESEEEMKDRYVRIQAELDGKSTFGHAGGVSLKDKWRRNKKTSNFEKKSNIRLAFIIVLLLALCYFMLYR
jgi:hypothetical protein